MKVCVDRTRSALTEAIESDKKKGMSENFLPVLMVIAVQVVPVPVLVRTLIQKIQNRQQLLRPMRRRKVQKRKILSVLFYQVILSRFFETYII